MGGINVARTCDLLSTKLEVTYQRNGFLVRLRGGSGIVCTKFERKDQQTIKSNQIKTIITSNTKTKTQQLYARFVSQSYRHKHRLSFFRLRKTHKFTHSPLPFKVPLGRKFIGLFPPNSVAEYRVLFIFLQKTEQQTFHPNIF